MADLANGYTKIANEIQKLKPRLRMSGREWQCLEAVIWLTYGWNKKQDRVTNTVIAELTDLGESHISDTIKSLAERKIIFAHKQGVMKIVGINTELSEWILDKPKTGKLFPESGKVLPKTGKPFPETGDTQYKNKNNSKRSSSSRNSKESRNEETLKFLSRHPEAADGIYTPAGKSWGTADDLKAARWIFDKALTVNASLSEPNWVEWANTIRLMRLRMSGREWQCLEAVIWLTYGWNKKQDRVTNTVIAELTDLGESHISDTIKSLAERKIIFAHKQGVMKIVGINTELSEWILDKPKTGKLFPESGKVLPKTGKPFPETGDTQYKNKNNSKRSSSSRNSKESRNEETLKFLSRHPEAADGIYTPAGKSWGTADDLKAARWIFDKALTVNASLSEPNWVEWANTIRLMRLQDKRTHYEICELFKWANENDFWQENILCPSKLRKQWDQLTTKRLRSHSPSKNKSGASALDNTDWIDGVLE